uniref:DDE-1 domain-containing protein n=1 Tax=Anopheles epiroticus TaxID=199890 RepID=A0A182PV98_9DIPT
MMKSRKYQINALEQCVQMIKDKKLSVYAASKKFGIPPSTCRYRLSSHWKQKNTPGPNTFLSANEEKDVVLWLQEIFTIAGRKWLTLFMKRHNHLCFRKPETITSASSRVSEKDIKCWFQSIKEWLKMNDMYEVLSDPSRIFNGDETAFNLHRKTKEVIAVKGSRNVYEIEQGSGKQNITVMFTFSADGCVVNPHVILPGQRIRKEIAQGFPPNWGLGQSQRGWMDTNNFREYILKVFHPWLVSRGVKFPIIFFVDGHSSHKSIEVADDAVKVGIKAENIKNGFRACGLFPFNSDNVDYSKCLNRPDQNSTVINDQEPNSGSTDLHYINIK